MGKRAIRIEDIFNFRWVGEPRMHPAGDNVAFMVRLADREKARYFSHLWLAPAAGGEPRPLTRGEVSDHCPRWSPAGDGLAFCRESDGAEQIWTLRLDGGEPAPLTRLAPGRIHGLAWSPDGRRLAFTWRPLPAPARAPGDTSPPAKGPLKPPLPGWRPPEPASRVITDLRYREEGTGWIGGRHDQLFVCDAASGEARQLTRGRAPAWGPAWSPDGRRLLFSANRQREPERNHLLIDLWTVPAAGGAPRLVRTQRGPSLAGAWSPDGGRIAYHGHARPDGSWGAVNTHVWTVGSRGGDAADAMPSCDRTAGNATISDMKSGHAPAEAPIWGPGGRSVLTVLSDDGDVYLCRVHLRSGRVERLIRGPAEVLGFSADRGGGRLALALAGPLSPGEIWTLDLRGGRRRLRRLTALNEAWLRDVELSRPERFSAAAPGGPRVTGWFLRPRGFRPGRRYPLALEVHGGPHLQYGDTFFHEFQVLASEGFVVAYGNPRGSQGRGEDFAGAIVNAWGDKDYADCMALADAMAARPFVDPRGMGILGGSYGGYMTSWAVGRTNRFRAAISMRAVNNLHSMAGTSDYGYEHKREFGAHAWEDPMRLLRMSPIHNVRDIRTPLLILHGEGDLRCPIEQAEQLYMALKILRRPVEFVRFPEENHDLSRGGRLDRRIERLRRVVDWLGHHLMGRRRVFGRGRASMLLDSPKGRLRWP